MKQEKTYKIGFDIGGVLSTHPDFFRALIGTLSRAPNWEVYYITDMPRENAEKILKANGIDYKDKLLCADWPTHEDNCKAVIAKQHGLDAIVDDHLPYLSSEEIPVGFLVAPRPSKSYNHPEWKSK